MLHFSFYNYYSPIQVDATYFALYEMENYRPTKCSLLHAVHVLSLSIAPVIPFYVWDAL